MVIFHIFIVPENPKPSYQRMVDSRHLFVYTAFFYYYNSRMKKNNSLSMSDPKTRYQRKRFPMQPICNDYLRLVIFSFSVYNINVNLITKKYIKM